MGKLLIPSDVWNNALIQGGRSNICKFRICCNSGRSEPFQLAIFDCCYRRAERRSDLQRNTEPPQPGWLNGSAASARQSRQPEYCGEPVRLYERVDCCDQSHPGRDHRQGKLTAGPLGSALKDYLLTIWSASLFRRFCRFSQTNTKTAKNRRTPRNKCSMLLACQGTGKRSRMPCKMLSGVTSSASAS
jgi:hypothetical protein